MVKTCKKGYKISGNPPACRPALKSLFKGSGCKKGYVLHNRKCVRRNTKGRGKKRATLIPVTRPSQPALKPTMTRIQERMQSVLDKYDVSEADYERATAAIESKLKENEKKARAREEQIEKRLVEAQKRVDKELAEAAKKVSKTKKKTQNMQPKKNCGKRRVIQIRAHARCAGRKVRKG